MSAHKSYKARRYRGAVVLALVLGGCTANVPGKFVSSTVPIDRPERINVVGKEAIGESCQWWISFNAYYFAGTLPLPMAGNQGYLTVENALGTEYDGLVGATTDTRITPFGIGFPISGSVDPRDWAHLFLISVCQEIRGTPFVYTKPLRGASP